MTTDEVIAGVEAGERRAIGRAISLVERLGLQGRELAAQLHPPQSSHFARDPRPMSFGSKDTKPP